jgi:hypothetical protein
MNPDLTLPSSSQLSGWDASFPRKIFGQRACWGLSTARRKQLVGRLFNMALRNDRNNTVLLGINWFSDLTHDKLLPPVLRTLHNLFRRRADGT